MRSITIITQWFPPEHAPIGHMLLELGEMLSQRGWQVTVITGFPNHPGGVVYPGYRKRLFQEERLGEIRLWRVYLYTSPRRSFFSRLLTFLSFTFSASVCLLLRGRPDVVFAALQPLSLGAVLPALARLKGARLVFNIQDLHPDAHINLGLIRNPLLIRALRALERYSYRHADGLSVICEDFRSHCIRAGAEPRRIAVIRNWIDLDEIRPGPRDNAFRAELGLTADDTLVLFAGTIGHASGAGVLLEVAGRLPPERGICIAFVGEGALVAELQEGARQRGLDNVLFSPFQPRERLAEVQASADISIVTLRPGAEVMSVPSKVLGYMAAARPVLAAAAADSETAGFIRESGAGVVVPPGDAGAIAAALLDLQDRPGERAAMGRSGRRYLEANLDRAHIGRRYDDFLAGVLAMDNH